MRGRHVLRWTMAAAVAVALACSTPPTPGPPLVGVDSGPAPGDLAPDFALKDLSGGDVRLSAYRGQVVLLDFWATWCAPCREEMPAFVDLQNKYRDAGLRILAVSVDDSEPPVREFAARYKLNFPVVMGDAALAAKYGGILGVPIAFLIDPNGRIRYKHTLQTEAPVFEREVRELLNWGTGKLENDGN